MTTQNTTVDNKVDNKPDNQDIHNLDNQTIINRVMSPKTNTKPQDNKGSNSDEIAFDPKMFDNISSVEDAKKAAEAAYKSYEKGFNKKFQDLAELKKTLEANISDSSSWTTEKIQSLLQNPSFVNAAQGVLSQSGYNKSSDNDEYSALSESEKQKIAGIERQNQLLLQQQNLLLMRQQDEFLKTKYPNYKSEAVDTITADLLQGKVKNTREYIWKAFDYEDLAVRAYKQGMEDARKNLNENIEVASFEGTQTIPSTPVKKEKGESNESLLKRLYSNALKNKRSNL